MRYKILSVCVGLIVLTSLLGCQGSPPSAPPLRVALLPILDSLPFYVAEAEGYFQDEGLAIELVAAGSAAERDQLLQAGQVDIVITDLVALALANRDQIEIMAVRYAMVPTEEFAQFRVLAAPGAGIETVTDLAGTDIGVSEGTVIEYVTDRLLAAEGLSPDQVQTIAVPRIPDRMALLDAGELAAATLPEPLGTLALQQGAQLVVDDTSHREYSCSIIAVRAEILESRAEAVRSLLDAIDRASSTINTNKDAWSDLLSQRQIVPPALDIGYELPDYPPAAVPQRSQVADVAAWLRDEERLTEVPSYDEMVTTDYLR